jgi:hypothetical protein
MKKYSGRPRQTDLDEYREGVGDGLYMFANFR